RALARELGPRNIRVNSVAPGYLETGMSESLGARDRERIVRRTPLGRLGELRDVTGIVRFLLSDEARFMTGQTLVVDGGITCGARRPLIRSSGGLRARRPRASRSASSRSRTSPSMRCATARRS